MVAPEHTDIAALSAAALAAALTLLNTRDKYGVECAAVTISLLLLIIGYAWSNRRTLTQSAAIASVVALSAIPGIGFVDEVHYFPGTWGELMCHGFDKGETNVPDPHMVVAWIAIFLSTLTIDVKGQRRASSN
jgi:hypothetical protein